jgi:phospholipase C
MSIGPAIATVAAPSHSASSGAPSYADNHTATPIKHVIVIIGENRSFDHVFATFVPKKPGVTIHNLLSEGIIALDADKDAIPGPYFEKAHQLAAADMGASDPFLLSPPKAQFPSDHLPAPLVGGPQVSYIPNKCGSSTPISRCAASLKLARQSESGLPASYYHELLTGGTGQTAGKPDQRITDVNVLPAGPYQLTNGSTFVYDDYAKARCTAFIRCGSN